MHLSTLVLETMVVSISGVMAPGPITTVILGKGNDSPHAGALVAIGHGIVEVPLMVAVYLGIGQLLDHPFVQAAISLLGGAVLLWMAFGMFKSVKLERSDSRMLSSPPLIAGILLSLGNPYFLIWWATVGASLILRAITFGIIGFIAMAAVHWICDFIWDYLLSLMSFKGGQFFGKRFQQIVFGVCGSLLFFFGGRMLVEGLHFFLN